jgi:septal ring factor EnvC (AmiA/AmiB activator)
MRDSMQEDIDRFNRSLSAVREEKETLEETLATTTNFLEDTKAQLQAALDKNKEAADEHRPRLGNPW